MMESGATGTMISSVVLRNVSIRKSTACVVRFALVGSGSGKVLPWNFPARSSTLRGIRKVARAPWSRQTFMCGDLAPRSMVEHT